MEVKIVGAITDENQLEEIHSIAQIFIYEQRMKEFISPGGEKDPQHNSAVKQIKSFIGGSKPVSSEARYRRIKGFM